MKTPITNETIFSTNWAHVDRRSVKASLSGRGDCRVLWWRINEVLHRLIHPGTTLEETMFAYHSRHISFTLFALKFRKDVDAVAEAIRASGIVEGVRTAIALDSEPIA